MNLSARTRITYGQVGLLLSLLFSAIFLDLIPDRESAVFEGRVMLAEAIAANSSVLINRSDIARLSADLRFVVERNEALLSAALRTKHGRLVADTGTHKENWQPLVDDHSTSSQIIVPIWEGSRRWGQVELRFRPLGKEGLMGVLFNPWVKLTLFFALTSFIAFYFYLGRMLKQLDPSQAIPGQVRSALDNMAEGLLVLDKKEQIVLANQAFAALIGKDPDALMGYRAADLPWVNTGDSEDKDCACPWSDALREGEPQRNVMIRLNSGEGQRTFMTNCSPVLGSKGKYGGVLVSFDDVTELEEKEIELRKSKEEAESANRSKSEFLANMSHEIRTPMNAILGFTEILKRGYGKNKKDSKQYLNTIHASGKHLLELINDILDLSKVEAGQLEVELGRCAPHHIIQELVQVLGIKAKENGISLEFQPAGELPETILTDQTRLRQIVTNLIGNAIKFTEQGGVKVTAVLSGGGQHPLYSIEVSDTGIGMSEAQQEQVFKPFQQADSSITRRFGGTGLGLSISKRFAEALGGDITVRSEPGKGSTFSLNLDPGPLDGIPMLAPGQLQEDISEIAAKDQMQWQFPDTHVLVVDDGVENRELVTLVLEEAGLHVDTAENGQEGVDKVLAGSYDLVFMDVMMPVMDGFTATRLLRGRGVETTIIALTAHAMKGFEKECLDAGFTGYMTKPIDIDHMIAELAVYLGGHQVEVDNKETKAIDTDDSRPEPGIRMADASPIVSSLPVGNPKFQAIIASFIERLAGKLDDMEDAWNRRDYDELAGLGHWLKGAGGTVGFNVFTEPAKNLELLAKDRSEDMVNEAIQALRSLASRLAISGDTQTMALEHAGVDDKASHSLIGDDGAGGEQDAEKQVVSRLAGNPRFHPPILKFIDRLDGQIKAMEVACQARDYAELASLAHWLKGSGGTVGFDVFTEPAKELEAMAKAKNLRQAEEMINQILHLTRNIVRPGAGER